MEKVENVIDEANPALSIACGLGQRKARQSVVANAAQFAVEVGALRPHVREGSHDARILLAPIETGPCQQLRPSALDARGHAETVEFDLMNPLRPRRSGLDELAEL